jgi:hypothetical protein
MSAAAPAPGESPEPGETGAAPGEKPAPPAGSEAVPDEAPALQRVMSGGFAERLLELVNPAELVDALLVLSHGIAVTSSSPETADVDGGMVENATDLWTALVLAQPEQLLPLVLKVRPARLPLPVVAVLTDTCVPGQRLPASALVTALRCPNAKVRQEFCIGLFQLAKHVKVSHKRARADGAVVARCVGWVITLGSPQGEVQPAPESYLLSVLQGAIPLANDGPVQCREQFWLLCKLLEVQRRSCALVRSPRAHSDARDAQRAITAGGGTARVDLAPLAEATVRELSERVSSEVAESSKPDLLLMGLLGLVCTLCGDARAAKVLARQGDELIEVRLRHCVGLSARSHVAGRTFSTISCSTSVLPARRPAPTTCPSARRAVRCRAPSAE